VITERFSIERGTIAVPVKPGLGIECDPERLARYKIDC
jgi:L-alanine-DL-glutamate epimerase-like enolase superfamily enzyme